ncbi:DNA-directed DNA polymerase [Tanacetum coccineum]
MPPVPFPRRLRKEKEEAQQKTFLENLKQLHINLPFIEALAQMPKYAKFLKDLGASISLMSYTMYEKLGLGEQMATRMSLELTNRSIQYPRGIIENVLIKVDKFVLPIDFVILDMPEDSRVPIILRRPFLATARAMIDVFNKKITLRVGDDEVIFNVDQSIKRPPTEDDECYGIDDLGNTINAEAQELLANEEPDSFLSRGLEKLVDQADLESCKSETKKPDKVESEHLYSASANEIDEKKLKLKFLPHHLEYAYLHGDKSFPIIISSELSEKEKISLLQVLEKRKGVIAWKMLDIKGISLSYCTHKILMEDDFKPVIQPQRRLNPKVQDVVKNEIVKLLDSGLIYLISNSSWVSPIHVVGEKGGMTVDFSRFLSHLRIRKRQLSPVLTGLLLIDECRLDYATHQLLMTEIFHDMVEDFMEVFMDDFLVFGFDIEIKDKRGAENLATDHFSRLENPDLGTFMEEEITDEFPDEHLMLLKAKLNNNEPFKMHQGKLKSKWYGLNVVKTVYPYGTVEITDKNRINFKVNGQRLKKYHDGHIDAEDKEVVEFEEDTT